MSGLASHPPHSEPVELVVAEDGSVPAAQLARLGVRPGARLRVIATPVQEPQRRKRKLEGALAGRVNGTALINALRDAKASRIAAIEHDL